MPSQPYRLLTLDLDDTLWPCAPVIRAAEEALYAWLTEVAPRLTDCYGIDDLRQQRRALMARRPELAHDLSQVRRVALAERLVEHGYPVALADEGLALFRAERNRVTPYPDVAPALRVLTGRLHLVSITNGNADVASSPLRGLFDLSLTAAEAGAARPDPAMFHLAREWAGVAPAECLHIGDDPYLDVEAARAAGLAAIWVNRSGRPWPEGLASPLATITDLVALPRWLAGETDAL